MPSNRRLGLVRIAAAAALALTGSAAVPVSAAQEATDTAAYIVVLRDDADARQLARQHALANALDVSFTYEAALKGYATRLSRAALARIRADPSVAYVAEDRPVTAFAQTRPTGIDRIDGELSSTVAGNGAGTVNVDVAVLDTGIASHADLTIAGGKNCSTGTGFSDGNGHGTHVSGTIAAKDNASGVVGVAPGARLWAVRVLNASGSGSFSSIICGVDWVTANRNTIEVVNMSLGGSGTKPTRSGCSTGDALHDAICRSVAAGVTYVVAAGNSSADARNSVPAAYDEVITVSALADFDGKPGGTGSPTCRSDEDDTLANFSNFGPAVDIIAPGVCILSTWLNGGYNTISGTSMASPHVAGAAALYKSNNPSATPAQVKSALQNAGTSNWSGDRDSTKEPLLNVDPF